MSRLSSPVRHRSGQVTRARTLKRVIYGILLVLTPIAAVAAPAENSSTPIETIVVQGQKLNVESRVDRKIYSVPEDAQSTLGTLSDVLSVIPSIDVDPDGVVSLRGDTNVLILIDGKPATQLQGSKAGDNLQSISAREIERIEVLTTPPAQFKAEGAAGVINIVTRKHRSKESKSASAQTSFGDGGRWLAGANGSYGGKDFTASVNAGYRVDYRARTIQSQVVGPDPTTGQVLDSQDHASQHIRRDVPTLGISGEYDPNELQSLSGSMSWMKRGGLRTYSQLDSSSLASGTVTSSTGRLTSGRDPEDDYNATLGFTQKFSSPGETLDFSLHRSISHQHEHYDYVNDSFVPPAPVLYDNLDFGEDNSITEADVDYTLPLSKTQTLKLGYAFEQDHYGFVTAGADVNPASGVQTLNPVLTSDFKFHQSIQAIYLSYQASMGLWTWLAGGRTEWTRTETAQVNPGVSTDISYSDVYPSLHVDRSLSDRSTISFGASRRVTRPDPDLLNPYVFEEYPPNFTAGNPNLRPQFTQSYESGYEYQGRESSYGLTGYYRRNQNGLTDVTEYIGQGLTVTSKTNLPRSDSAGLEFAATGHIFRTLSYGLSGNAFYTQIDATALGFPGLKSTSGVNAKVKLDYHPSAADSAQLTFTRTDKRLTPQGSVSAINLVNLGFKHAFTSAFSAVATVSDLFDGQRYQRVAITPTLTQVYERTVAGRVAFVGVVNAIGVEKTNNENFEYDSGAER